MMIKKYANSFLSQTVGQLWGLVKHTMCIKMRDCKYVRTYEYITQHKRILLQICSVIKRPICGDGWG